MAANGDAFVAALALMVVTIFLMVGIYANRYKRVPPDQALVVFGRARGDHGFIVIGPGGGKFIPPVTESFKFISLAPRPLNFTVFRAVAAGAPLDVQLRIEYKVSAERTQLDLAAQHLLSRSPEGIDQMVEETIAARLRAICSALEADEVGSHRDELARKLREVSGADLREFGLEIIHLLVVDVVPSEGRPGPGVPAGLEGDGLAGQAREVVRAP